MGLALYRRHRRDCKASHPEELRTSEYDERKKGWKRCECPIFVSGTLDKIFKRQTTGHWEWDAAKVAAATLQHNKRWEREIVLPPVSVQVASRTSIAEVIQTFLANRQNANISPSTFRKYKTFAKLLTDFANSKGYVALDQFTPAAIDAFYGSWTLGVRAKSKRLSMLRSFFRFCLNREWIAKSPVSPDIKPPIGANRLVNKAPFTDDELSRILDACDNMPDLIWRSGMGHGVWRGSDVKDFILTMVYTGLRISDVGEFHIDRLRGNEVFLRAKKNGGDVFTYIPDWLRDRLLSRSKERGPRPFVVGRSERLDTITDMWRRKIGSVFQLAGTFDEPPSTHRFRHTFARILLQHGVPVAEVADLMGDDEKTIRVHYARWVPERQARLTKILQDAFKDKPKPKLAVISQGKKSA